MTTTRTDRGSTDTTTIYSENGDLTYERAFAARLDRGVTMEADACHRHQ